MTRSNEKELAIIRSAYAAHILAEAGVRSAPLERAFAAVPREAFLGRGYVPKAALNARRTLLPRPCDAAS